MSNEQTYDECKTCGCEIIETVNDSVFHDDECRGCEYLRYRTQPELVAVLDELIAETIDKDLEAGNELSDRESALRDEAMYLISLCGRTASGKRDDIAASQ